MTHDTLVPQGYLGFRWTHSFGMLWTPFRRIPRSQTPHLSPSILAICGRGTGRFPKNQEKVACAADVSEGTIEGAGSLGNAGGRTSSTDTCSI